MAFVGLDIPAEYLKEIRLSFNRELNASEVLKKQMPIAGFWTFEGRREVYKGDYYIWAHSKDSGFWKIGKFGFLPMPGCRAIVCFYHSEVESAFRGMGIGKELLRIRLEVAKQAGFKAALATVREDNIRECDILRKANFTGIACYPSKRDGAKVIVMWRQL